MDYKKMKACIAQLAKSHGREVFKAAYRLLGDKHLAEDVVQEVFIKLFKKSPAAFDKILNWPAYLKTMASSIAIDQLRRQTRLAEESYNHADICSIGNQQAVAEPYRDLAVHRDLEYFRQALTALSQQDAQVFCLRYIEEFSYQEIADQLGISNSLVGVTLHRAQQKLSQLVGESQFLGAGHEITG